MGMGINGNESQPDIAKQAISARKRALCQLTVCFKLQSGSDTRKGHKSRGLKMVFRSYVTC